MDDRKHLRESLINTTDAAAELAKYSIMLNGGAAVAISAMVIVRKADEVILMNLRGPLILFVSGCALALMICLFVFMTRVTIFDELLAEKFGKEKKQIKINFIKGAYIFMALFSVSFFIIGVLIPIFWH